MDYEKALAYIHNTLKFGIKLNLQNITRLLEKIGKPHKKLKFVHIAGTNGKGSVASFINSILVESNYKVGLFTSPYLQCFSERIKINNCNIPDNDIVRIVTLIKQKNEELVAEGFNHPTEFEIVTALAFKYFCENDCDIVILEVGLGGRFDSTNVIEESEVSVITPIGMDHTKQLGDSLEKIAFEKGGIIKPYGNVIIYPQASEVENLLIDICRTKNASHKIINTQNIKIIEMGLEGTTFQLESGEEFSISLLGEHQVNNAIIAIETVNELIKKGYKITNDSIKQGLAKNYWPGRLEIISQNPLFLIDSAHNADGAKSLYNALCKYFGDKKYIFIIGVLKDKDVSGIFKRLLPLAHKAIAVAPLNNRALKVEDLAKEAKRYCKNTVISDTISKAIVDSIKECEEDNKMVCAFGSIYLIGEIKNHFERGLSN